MNSLPVVEQLNVFKDLRPRLVSIVVVAMMDQFVL